jgi:O-antigen ligase
LSALSASAFTRREAVASAAARSDAVRILQVFAVILMVIPSNIVLRPIGGVGYPAALVGMFAFTAWLAATILGVHGPQRHRHPIRGVLCFFWLTTLASYVLMDRASLTGKQLLSADRFLMELAVISGVALIASDCLTSMHDVRRVLRALTWGGAFCGVVAALQFYVKIDLATYLRMVPGFSVNADDASITARDAVNRVSGTAIHPIELGVVAAILLPLAIHLAIFDTHRRPRVRWAPVALIALAIPASVSRSAVIGLAITMVVLLVSMPGRQRLTALVVAPFALGAVFMTAHGLIGTLASYFGLSSGNDSSLAHRTNTYPYAEGLVRKLPWLGHGGGTYIPDTQVHAASLHILDNQYLKTAIELGLVGVVALAALFLIPMIVAFTARRRSEDPELRLLCGALGGAILAAGVCSAFFDALSFPMFYCVSALVIGLIGACWRLATTGDEQDVGAGNTAAVDNWTTDTKFELPARIASANEGG